MKKIKTFLIPLFIIFISISYFYIPTKSKSLEENKIIKDVVSTNTSNYLNNPKAIIEDSIITNNRINKNIDHFILIQQAANSVDIMSKDNLTILNSKILDMKKDTSITIEEKTQILWDIMKNMPDLFSFFTEKIIDLAPYYILDELLLFFHSSQSPINSLDTLIILEFSLNSTPDKFKAITLEKIGDFVSTEILNVNSHEGIYIGLIDLYTKIFGEKQFNQISKDILSLDISNKNKVSVYMKLINIKDPDYLSLINNLDLSEINNKDRLLINHVIRKNIISEKSGDKKKFLPFITSLQPKITNNIYSRDDILEWIKDYSSIENKELAYIHAFEEYGDDVFLSASIIMESDKNINMELIDSENITIKNIYKKYQQLHNDGKIDEANYFKNVILKITKDSLYLKEKYKVHR